jgi:uncharacterized protein YciI
MHAIAICRDKPGALETRLAIRPKHLEHAARYASRMLAAGATLGEDGKPTGSLFIFINTTPEEVRRIMDEDPFVKAGIYESVSVERWRWAINRPEGIAEE